jgi:hypothetical protein
MRTATIRLRVADLSREMAAMRLWLDRNGHTATRFDCRQNGDAVVLSVDFAVAEAAEAFAARFDGEDGPQASPPSAPGRPAAARDIGRERQLGK